MKPSRYNCFIDLEDGRRLAFNGISANLSEIYPEKASIVAGLLENPHEPVTVDDREIYQALIDGKYLIDDEFDEVEFLKVRNRRRRFDKSTYFMTIAPTLGCNFHCEYCFESGRPERMDDEVEQAILKYSEKYMKRAEMSGVIWFGGEPTLCIPTIERLQSDLRELAERCGSSFDPGSIITNGFLLDGKLAERLKGFGIESAQVTIDGPQEIHDQRRRLRNGGGTYNRIVSNLVESSEILKIIIRVNIDRQNIDNAFDAVEQFDKMGILPRVNIHFAQVHNSEGVCADIEKHCFATEEFSHNLVRLYRRLVDNGFYRIEYPSLTLGGHCGADTDGSFVFGPSGDIFKCWEDISLPEWSVGSVFSEETSARQHSNLLKYLGWDPFEREECVSCSILPICMGGCPRQSLEKSNRVGSCVSWKYNLREMLTMRYECDIGKEVR
jgi:uncharacterized protein